MTAYPRVRQAKLLAAALHYAGRGWPVFPMGLDKRPPFGLGLRSATRDPELVRLLFGTVGARLVAIATGTPSGVAAIDIDPAAIGWFEGRRRLFRPTWTERTPRKGYHLLYIHPPGLRCSGGKIAPGVDIRGDGGSCIIAGPGYEIIDGRDPTEIPSLILVAIAQAEERKTRLATARAPHRSGGDIEALKSFVARSLVGERSNRLFWAASRAGENAGELLSAAQECGFDKSFTQAAALATIRSGMRSAKQRSA